MSGAELGMWQVKPLEALRLENGKQVIIHFFLVLVLETDIEKSFFCFFYCSFYLQKQMDA